MTQKLQTLAINALEDLKKSTYGNPTSIPEIVRLYNAWDRLVEDSLGFYTWRDFLWDLIDSMIESYKNNSKNIPLRHYYVESNHIRIQVDIHGGLKDASGKVCPFEVYARILLS